MNKRYKILVFLAFAMLLSSLIASFSYAEDSIYDVINREDTDTFSDMVVLGYDVDDVDGDGYTPLMIAAALGKAKFARFLIHNNAKVDKRSFNGMTALHRAAQGGHNELIDILHGAGAYIDMPDFNGDTPLMVATRSNRRFTVERLLALGADINYMNAKGETALSIAYKKRFKKIASYLKSQGAR